MLGFSFAVVLGRVKKLSERVRKLISGSVTRQKHFRFLVPVRVRKNGF